MGYADMGRWPRGASLVHKQSAAATKIDGRRAVLRSICLRKRRRGRSVLAFERLLGWAQTPVVDIAAHRHLTSPARLGTMGSVMVRAGDVDNSSLRGTSVVDLTVRIGFGVSAASRTGKEVIGWFRRVKQSRLVMQIKQVVELVNNRILLGFSRAN